MLASTARAAARTTDERETAMATGHDTPHISTDFIFWMTLVILLLEAGVAAYLFYA